MARCRVVNFVFDEVVRGNLQFKRDVAGVDRAEVLVPMLCLPRRLLSCYEQHGENQSHDRYGDGADQLDAIPVLFDCVAEIVGQGVRLEFMPPFAFHPFASREIANTGRRAPIPRASIELDAA